MRLHVDLIEGGRVLVGAGRGGSNSSDASSSSRNSCALAPAKSRCCNSLRCIGISQACCIMQLDPALPTRAFFGAILMKSPQMVT